MFPEMCELCGAARDTLCHRLWACPCIDKEPREYVDADVLAGVKEFASTKSRLSTLIRGGMPYPGDDHPPPLTEGAWQVDWNQDPPPPQPLAIQGKVFIDGSASRHPIRELSRACWSAAMFSDAPCVAPFGPRSRKRPRLGNSRGFGVQLCVLSGRQSSSQSVPMSSSSTKPHVIASSRSKGCALAFLCSFLLAPKGNVSLPSPRRKLI
eukprot:7061338-Pyramimonas_sp.AAC.1